MRTQDRMHSGEVKLKPSEKEINSNIFQLQVQELGLKVDKNKNDEHELKDYLNRLLSYPESKMADIHENSNKLGTNDLKTTNSQILQLTQRESGPQKETMICGCCGFIYQDEELKLCSYDFSEIAHLGLPTLIFFRTIINVALLLIVMLIVYSAYTLASNIIAAQNSSSIDENSSVFSYLKLSLGSKTSDTSVDAPTLYLVSAWLGVAMVTLWGIILLYMKFKLKHLEGEEDYHSKSVSEYSLMIQKMPTGLTLKNVQAQFDQYLANIDQKERKRVTKLKIEKYNEGKPFYFSEESLNDKRLTEILKEGEQIKQSIANLVLERKQNYAFTTSEPQRANIRKRFEENQKEKGNKYDEILKDIKVQLAQKNKTPTTTVFITFENSHQKNFVLRNNESTFKNAFVFCCPCTDKSKRLVIRDTQGNYVDNLIISQAPEPEDINWANIGVQNCQLFSRKFLTYSATAFLLGVSFIIVFGLSKAQNANSNNRYVSILISIVISIVNLTIIKVLQYMTLFERDLTMNNYQFSLAFKSIVAQLLNTILIPIIANYYIKQNNIYKSNGLVEDVFILAITTSIVGPLIRIFDPYYFYVSLKARYYDYPERKLLINQYQLNKYKERMQFQIGYEYIYVVTLFLFICFYVSLEPIIPIFAIIGLIAIYWAEKYALFNRSQRPVPGIDTISSGMNRLIYFGAAAYALGSLTWANLLPDSLFTSSLVPNLISAGLALIIFLLPYEIIFKCGNNSQSMYFEGQGYLNDKMYFPSEYDRLNPSTSKQGIQDYRKFIQHKKSEIQGLSDSEKHKIQLEFLNQAQNNFYKNSAPAFVLPFQNNARAEILNNIFQAETKNMINPQNVASFIFPENVRMTHFKIAHSHLKENNKNQQKELGPSNNLLSQQFIVSKDHSNKLIDEINRTEVDPHSMDNKLQNPYYSNIMSPREISTHTVLGVQSKIEPENQKEHQKEQEKEKKYKNPFNHMLGLEVKLKKSDDGEE